MPYSVCYNELQHVIETRYHGVLPIEEIVAELEESHALATEKGCFNYLADASDAEFDFEPSQLFGMPALQEGMGGDRHMNVAIIPPPDARGREMVEFYTTFASNRGFACQSFDSIEEAKTWLRNSAAQTGSQDDDQPGTA